MQGLRRQPVKKPRAKFAFHNAVQDGHQAFIGTSLLPILAEAAASITVATPCERMPGNSARGAVTRIRSFAGRQATRFSEEVPSTSLTSTSNPPKWRARKL